MQTFSKSKVTIIALMLPALVTACASQTAVTFTSEPPGAVITELNTGTDFGNAPTAIKRYDLELDGILDEEGCYVLNGVQARWESGAVEQMAELQLCGNHLLGYTVNLVRPASFPDVETDLVVAQTLQSAGNAKRDSFGSAARSYELNKVMSFQSDRNGGAPTVWFSAPPPGYTQPQIHFGHPPR